MAPRKSLGGKHERSGVTIFFPSQFVLPTQAGCVGADHTTCFSFLETGCSFKPSPQFHESSACVAGLTPLRAVCSWKSCSPLSAAAASRKRSLITCGWMPRPRCPSRVRPACSRPVVWRRAVEPLTRPPHGSRLSLLPPVACLLQAARHPASAGRSPPRAIRRLTLIPVNSPETQSRPTAGSGYRRAEHRNVDPP